MRVRLGTLKALVKEVIEERDISRFLREVVIAGEADPADMRSDPFPEDNYRAEDPLDYIGMARSPYPEDNYRAEDPLAYIGMHPQEPEEAEEDSDENGLENDAGEEDVDVE